MITVSIGGQEIVVKTKKLIDYIEKLDFIKMRRTSPYDLVREFPTGHLEGGSEGARALVEIAMRTVYTQSSSVSFQEELAFDSSEEGVYWNLWKCLAPVVVKKGQPEPWQQGINRARRIWEDATSNEKTRLRLALDGVDERSNLGNSDGLTETSVPSGHPEPSLP